MAAAPLRLPSTANAVQTVVLWPTQPSEQRLPILMYPYGGPTPSGSSPPEVHMPVLSGWPTRDSA